MPRFTADIIEKLTKLLGVSIEAVCEALGIPDVTVTHTIVGEALNESPAEAIRLLVHGRQQIILAAEQWCSNRVETILCSLGDSVKGLDNPRANQFALVPVCRYLEIPRSVWDPVYRQLLEKLGWRLTGRPIEDGPRGYELTRETLDQIKQILITERSVVVGWDVYPAPNLMFAEEEHLDALMARLTDLQVDLQSVRDWISKTLEKSAQKDAPTIRATELPANILDFIPGEFVSLWDTDLASELLMPFNELFDQWSIILLQQIELVGAAIMQLKARESDLEPDQLEGLTNNLLLETAKAVLRSAAKRYKTEQTVKDVFNSWRNELLQYLVKVPTYDQVKKVGNIQVPMPKE